MFNFPFDTFWIVVPWPFIWLVLGIIMYFIKRRDDKLEDIYLSKEKGDEQT